MPKIQQVIVKYLSQNSNVEVNILYVCAKTEHVHLLSAQHLMLCEFHLYFKRIH